LGGRIEVKRIGVLKAEEIVLNTVLRAIVKTAGEWTKVN
jgi:hypothetical protein